MSPAPYSSKSRAPRSAILHLSPDLEPGDPARETVDLAILSQRAAPWRALIASIGGSLVKEAERAAARHYRMPLNGRGLLNDWRSRLQLEAVVQKEHPSLIHAHGIAVLPFAYALSRLHRMPLIVDLTQPITEPEHYAKLMANLKLAPAILRVPSHFMATHLRDTFKVEPEQMQIVPPGIDLQWYGAGFISPERLQTLSTMWRLPEQAVVVLVPMPLAPGFGQEVFA